MPNDHPPVRDGLPPRCCPCAPHDPEGLTRRGFLGGVGLAAAAVGPWSWPEVAPSRSFNTAKIADNRSRSSELGLRKPVTTQSSPAQRSQMPHGAPESRRSPKCSTRAAIRQPEPAAKWIMLSTWE